MDESQNVNATRAWTKLWMQITILTKAHRATNRNAEPKLKWTETRSESKLGDNRNSKLKWQERLAGKWEFDVLLTVTAGGNTGSEGILRDSYPKLTREKNGKPHPGPRWNWNWLGWRMWQNPNTTHRKRSCRHSIRRNVHWFWRLIQVPNNPGCESNSWRMGRSPQGNGIGAIVDDNHYCWGIALTERPDMKEEKAKVGTDIGSKEQLSPLCKGDKQFDE